MSGETFAALLTPSLPSIRKFVQTRVRVSDFADDILQQTLLQAFARRDQLRVPAKFKSWICSIAMNELRMFFRRQRATISLDQFPRIDFRDRRLSPLARFEQVERMRWLYSGLAKLPDRDRTAIRLRDLDEMTLAEIAGVLDRPQAAAKSTHFRARRRLARILHQEPGLKNIRACRSTAQNSYRETDSTVAIDL